MDCRSRYLFFFFAFYLFVSTVIITFTKAYANDKNGLAKSNIIIRDNAIINDIYFISDKFENLSKEENQAVDFLRAELVKRNEKIIVEIKKSRKKPDTNIIEKIFNCSLRPTDKGYEGDYLKWNIKSYKGSGEVLKNSDGTYNVSIVYNIVYNTTFEEEIFVENQLKQVEAEINDSSISEKIVTINDFICSYLSYDNDHNDSSYNAYGALKNKKAVCQSYSLLFYRLATDLGIKNRIMAGHFTLNDDSTRHGWNIISIDGIIYHIDTTYYDDSRDSKYLLKNWNYFADGRAIDKEYAIRQ